jgi:hypothetical protein
MAGYIYKPYQDREALNEYEAWGSETSKRLSDILASNQAAAKATQDAEVEKERKAQFKADTNIAAGGLQGASIGAAGGPWGALIGMGIGAASKIPSTYRAWKEKRGGSVWGGIRGVGNSLLNPIKGLSELKDAVQAPGGVQQAAAVAGTMSKAGFDKNREARKLAARSSLDSASSDPSSLLYTGKQQAITPAAAPVAPPGQTIVAQPVQAPVGDPSTQQPGEDWWSWYNRTKGKSVPPGGPM